MSFDDTSGSIINSNKQISKRSKLPTEIQECPNIDVNDDGILLILQRYYESGYRIGPNGSGEFRELRTIFSNENYKTGLDYNDQYLDAISKGNVKLAIHLIQNKAIDPLYVKWGSHFGEAHALHYILQNLKYIKSETNKQHPKYKELVLFIQQFLLPNMTNNYINTKYFQGGDMLDRGTRVAIMEMIVSVNDIDLVKLIMTSCKNMINFSEKSAYFGGGAYGSKEWSIFDDCIENKIDSNIFEYLLTEPNIAIHVNEYLNSYGGFICGETEKYTVLHKIIKQNNAELFKKLIVCCKNVNINIAHETVKRKRNDKSDKKIIENKFVDEKIIETSLHIAIKNNNEYLIKLLIIHGIDANIEYLISVRDQESQSFVDRQGIDIFNFINKIKDKTIEMDENILDTFNVTNIKNIIIQRYYADMIDEYPLKIQQSIKIILFRFPNIGEIILTYFL